MLFLSASTMMIDFKNIIFFKQCMHELPLQINTGDISVVFLMLYQTIRIYYVNINILMFHLWATTSLKTYALIVESCSTICQLSNGELLHVFLLEFYFLRISACPSYK